MIDQQDITIAVHTLGLTNKDVCIHASMRSFQEIVEGGIEMITNTFLYNGCTIMVPTFTYQFEAKPIHPYMPERNGAGDYTYFLSKDYDTIDEVFSIGSKAISAQEMGIFSKYILERVDSLRGNHPLNSFTALGLNAKTLIEHQSPGNVYAPLEKLVGSNGYVLLMGVDLDCATIIHYAEQFSGRNLFVRWAYDQNRNVVPVRTGGCSDGFSNFKIILENAEIQTLVGKSIWRCYRAKDIVELCTNAIRVSPSITHCDNKNCERCNDAVLGGPTLSVNF